MPDAEHKDMETFTTRGGATIILQGRDRFIRRQGMERDKERAMRLSTLYSGT